MLKKNNVLWLVELSNGERHYENKGEYKTTKTSTAWQKLQNYLVTKKIKIVAMALFVEVDGNNIYHYLPSTKTNPNYPEFKNKQPLDYSYDTKLSSVLKSKVVQNKNTSYKIAIAHYDNYQLQIWVDITDPRSAHSIVVAN